jgi:hypothetical protein
MRGWKSLQAEWKKGFSLKQNPKRVVQACEVAPQLQKSKIILHERCYERAKELFSLNTALIQTARDKAVEILMSFAKNRRGESVLNLKRISIRFHSRCYRFSKTTNALTPYWLTLSLTGGRESPYRYSSERDRELRKPSGENGISRQLKLLSAMENGTPTSF